MLSDLIQYYACILSAELLNCSRVTYKNRLMRAVTMLPVFLLAMHQVNYREYLTSINQPIRELFRARRFSDVQIIVHDPYENRSEIMNNMYKTISHILPTSWILLNNSIPRKLPSFRVSRGTLILYVYFSKTAPDPQQSKDIVDVIVYNEVRPKVLLLTVLEEENCNFRSLLMQMWDNLLPNAMILELPKFNGNRSAVMVHQYNPFTRVYDRRRYTSRIEWFPNKLKNLYGYPINVYQFNRPGVLNMTIDFEGYPVSIDGPDAKVLEVLARALNFTPIMTPFAEMFLADHITVRGVEIIMVSLPFFMDKSYQTLGHTLPLTMESWCPVVPVVYELQPIQTRAIVGIGINFIVVSVVWAISIILKFDQKSWQPLKIFGMILSTTVSIKPKRMIEMVVFLGIVCVSSICSTSLYADLTTTNLRGTSQTDYNSFDDLNQSGLVPVIFNMLFNVTFAIDDPSFLRFKKRAVTTKRIENCGDYLARYKNVTCFMEEKLANLIIYSYTRRGERVMAVCKNLCYSKPPIGYFMRKNSAYTDRVTEIMIRLQMSGIREKWDQDYVGKFSPRKTYFMHIDEQHTSTLVFNLIRIGAGGCFLSLLVFFAEIMANRIRNTEKE